MVKQRKNGLRFPLFKRKNINNGSGDNNNNSNEGEKTKEMVLGHPPKRRLMRLNNFGNTVRTGADPMEPVGDSGNIERYSIDWQQFLQPQLLQEQLLQELQQLSQQQQQQLLQDLLQQEWQLLQQQQSQQLQQQLRLPWLQLQLQRQRLPPPQHWLPSLLFQEQQQLLQLLQRQKELQTKVKASGDGDSGSGSGSGSAGDSGGDCGNDGDDNDGGDKTKGGGGGKMGTKIEPNGRHDYRNRFSYHGGDENGYPVGQLHRCYYEKPNVCSIIPYQRKNINNGSGDNNNNSNEGEKTKEMVHQIKLKTFGDMVRTGANPVEPVGESGNIKNYHIDQPSQQLQLQLQQQQPSWQLLQQQKELQTKVKAGGDGDSGSDGGNGSGDDGGDNDSGHKTEGGGSGKMGTKMEPKGQHDNRNRFSCHGGDENGYPVGQLHSCYYQKPNVYSIIPYEVLV